MKSYAILYQPWKTQNNIINIGGVINLQMGHVYNEATLLIYNLFEFAVQRIPAIRNKGEIIIQFKKSIALQQLLKRE